MYIGKYQTIKNGVELSKTLEINLHISKINNTRGTEGYYGTSVCDGQQSEYYWT